MKTYRPVKALGFNSYKEYLNSYLWKDKRNFIISLKPFCEKCKGKKSTQVHHLNYDSVTNENQSDLIALCRECHKKIHGIKDDRN